MWTDMQKSTDIMMDESAFVIMLFVDSCMPPKLLAVN